MPVAAPAGGVLARYRGERPPAPDWFARALARAPERSAIEVDGVAIELQTWGAVGKPGLLFVHGNSAHADWWSFIAPFFADDWRCAAISLSGMGRSGRRAHYDLASWTREALAAIDAAELDGGDGVRIVAHSLGGFVALAAAVQDDRVRGVISLDSLMLPSTELGRSAGRDRPHRIYATCAEALARFRFLPPWIGDQHYAIDHVARASLVPVAGGWSWAFDPAIWTGLEERAAERLSALPRAVNCPVALMLGERSELFRPDTRAFMRAIYPDGAPMITIPEAGHHMLLDQPLAVVAAIRATFAGWRKAGG